MLTTINLDLVKPKGIGRMRFSRTAAQSAALTLMGQKFYLTASAE
jgi:hypothetical protein